MAALKLNTNLRELYLGDNKICSADGVQIGNLLRANACLDILDLRKNHIQDIGLDHICEGLAHQPFGGLRILNLSDNQLTSRAMSHLSQCLVSGCSAHCISESSNQSVAFVRFQFQLTKSGLTWAWLVEKKSITIKIHLCSNLKPTLFYFRFKEQAHLNPILVILILVMWGFCFF